MIMAIPKYLPTFPLLTPRTQSFAIRFEVKRAVLNETALTFQKICAQLNFGVRFGIGIALERSCGTECPSCNGVPFDRQHRVFDFSPHFKVKLDTTKVSQPTAHVRFPHIFKDDVCVTSVLCKGPNDSYRDFRSDFVHLSISLSSSAQASTSATSSPSSFHLTPKAFSHFWSWWNLFDGTLSLPIRHGSYYPPRTPSPKLARHLATIKYRISVADLFITHVYIDDSQATWADGLTPFVGVKTMVSEFKADLHQRETEHVIPGSLPDSVKISRHKNFYAAEVVLKDLDLRALLAIFPDPLKQSVNVTLRPLHSNYRTRNDLPQSSPLSSWFHAEDFVETDWSSSERPTLHILPVVACPRFTYFKRTVNAEHSNLQSSKFGFEDTHTCLLGKDDCELVSGCCRRVAHDFDSCSPSANRSDCYPYHGIEDSL
jgi:hypothetical protein